MRASHASAYCMGPLTLESDDFRDLFGEWQLVTDLFAHQGLGDRRCVADQPGLRICLILTHQLECALLAGRESQQRAHAKAHLLAAGWRRHHARTLASRLEVAQIAADAPSATESLAARATLR